MEVTPRSAGQQAWNPPISHQQQEGGVLSQKGADQREKDAAREDFTEGAGAQAHC